LPILVLASSGCSPSQPEPPRTLSRADVAEIERNVIRIEAAQQTQEASAIQPREQWGSAPGDEAWELRNLLARSKTKDLVRRLEQKLAKFGLWSLSAKEAEWAVTGGGSPLLDQALARAAATYEPSSTLDQASTAIGFGVDDRISLATLPPKLRFKLARFASKVGTGELLSDSDLIRLQVDFKEHADLVRRVLVRHLRNAGKLR